MSSESKYFRSFLSIVQNRLQKIGYVIDEKKSDISCGPAFQAETLSKKVNKHLEVFVWSDITFQPKLFAPWWGFLATVMSTITIYLLCIEKCQLPVDILIKYNLINNLGPSARKKKFCPRQNIFCTRQNLLKGLTSGYWKV